MLSRHPFGNYVVQTAMEHCHTRSWDLLSQLLPDFATLVTNRTGSLVAQRVLDYSDGNHLTLALEALLQGDGASSLVEIACDRYGSYVIEQLGGLQHSLRADVASILACN